MRGLQRAARRSVWSGPGNSGAAPRPGCEPLRPLSFKSPPGTGNRGNAGEMRPRPAIPASTPPARPRPGRTNIPCTPRPAARSSVPRDPSPLHAPPCTAFLLELAMERTQTRNPRSLQRNVTPAYFDGPEAARDSVNINHQTGSQ
ncbi:translation initiation factor IF-2-like [Ursus arctos]|uniref:translation initiation factor IF-2-like n=1 Tax=Ursus arctos TaxID=9644 RepID=UPI000E6DD4BB|nr:translation initiation factor IF-2-like [Ursus arctos]